MKILVAMDSFKGSVSSKDLNTTIKKSIQSIKTIDAIETFPISDGGEGFLDAIKKIYKNISVTVKTIDLLGNPCIANYIIIEKNKERIAVIESAQVLGIHLTNNCAENLFRSSSYGLGLVIQDALKQKVDKILVGLGGTGTIDGGLGILESLNHSHINLKKFNPLLNERYQCLKNISLKKFPVPVIGVSDVNNPYSGIDGAANVFGKQKGATPELIKKLNKKMDIVRLNIINQTNIDLNQCPGTGSAGGIGGILSIIGDRVIPASTFIKEYLNIEEIIRNVDLVITGEGKIDEQTFFGKAPFVICQIAEDNKIPAVIFCGSNSLDCEKTRIEYKHPIFCIQQQPITKEKALNKDTTLKNIAILSKNIITFWLTKISV